ncbi:hypothetical protein J7E93_36340 [Streptomyces sp. ISL-36]|uniref:hypothetical protein n=1 Tax=Streptomyces sp. ISL-36 TaxID=2819182 RepID=UPI001BE8A3CB|nr:hypothetical protein [Streptomyces sp. ISL-36]MBT2445456.1 hypothetical protein [Streptomyces sp. ISL-36]
MAVRDIRTAAKLIGRRNALRYLAIGVGASLMAACTGKEKPAATSGPSAAPRTGTATASPATPSDPPSSPAPPSSPPSATPTKRGVLDRSFEAFVRGAWTIESTTPGGDVARGKGTVDLSSWSIDWGTEGGTWQGGYRLHGGGILAIEVYQGPDALTRESGTQAHSVPELVSDGFTLSLPWQPPGTRSTGDGQRLAVAYADNVLTIRHIEPSGSTSTHVCTRA